MTTPGVSLSSSRSLPILRAWARYSMARFAQPKAVRRFYGAPRAGSWQAAPSAVGVMEVVVSRDKHTVCGAKRCRGAPNPSWRAHASQCRHATPRFRWIREGRGFRDRPFGNGGDGERLGRGWGRRGADGRGLPRGGASPRIARDGCRLAISRDLSGRRSGRIETITAPEKGERAAPMPPAPAALRGFRKSPSGSSAAGS